MASFYIPLSGLNAAQSSLQAISSNLANVDTDGYKGQSLTFGDVFQIASTTNGAGDPVQPGSGVTVQSTYYNESDGTAVATGVASNMALSGSGFFVVQQANGSIAYSRAGDFSLTKDGQLTTSSGALVLGYPATSGVVNTAAPVQPLTIGTGTVLPATATGNFSSTTNLDASSDVGTTTQSEISVYDSLGDSHQLTINFQKTASNTWSYNITMPAADGALTSTPTPTGATTVSLASGSLSFDSSGALTSTTPISMSSFTPSDGAAPLALKWDLADSNGNGVVTQSALASSTSATSQDGTASATLSSYTIGADGTIEGTFSTGKTLALGRVAVADVTNVQGMAHIGENLYEVTASSGPASMGTAGTGGRGEIQGGYVEQSNVSVATEFSNMIVAQQAYQANAKSVTTFDQLMQATINMLQG